MSDQKFIVVSNRLPVTIKKQDGKLTFSPSPGGLATAMSSVETDGDMLWVGWPGIPSEELTTADKRIITKKLKDYNCFPVFLTAQQVEEFYEGYSNETLWPLFHYFHSIAQFNESHWEAYQKVNSLFAKAVLKFTSADTTIWVHDYHLLLLPEMLRKAQPQSSIGFFLHIPFPSFEIFRLLPHREDILRGLMGADLVGFHIYDYARHFTSSVQRTLGSKVRNGSIAYGDRIVKADAFPIGIDYDKFKDAVASPEVTNEIKHLKDHYKGQKIILSVDRLDYSKGIAHRLEAFELFLKKNPQQHKKVTMVMIAVPSRTEVSAYKDLRDNIEQTISRINGTYATVDWTPVSYQFQNQPFNDLVALYAIADVALVTPIRDGMNLVAKEYIAAKQTTTGVLILSELTGAIDELQESLVVNPNDTAAIVDAIKQALTMPLRQKKERIAAMQRRISSYDVQRWASDFLEQLEQLKQQTDQQNSKLLTRSQTQTIAQDYKSSRKRLIVLDYDGTLRHFVGSAQPTAAKPTRAVIQLLTQLGNDPNNTVYIVSGRPRTALDQWFESLPVNLIAEHGYWVKQDNTWVNHDVNTEYKMHIMPTLIKYTERTPGSTLEDKSSSLVWHYRNVSPELAYVRKRNLKHDLLSQIDQTAISVYNGNKIIEIKPKSINKGAVVSSITKESDYDFVLCAGDDYTDEDMFAALHTAKAGHTIKVGIGDTEAAHQVKSVDDLVALLQEITR